MTKFSRRELLKCLAAGGAVVAGELWVPGARTIFIPSHSLDESSGRWVSLNIDDFSRRYIEPAMRAMAASIEDELLNVTPRLQVRYDLG